MDAPINHTKEWWSMGWREISSERFVGRTLFGGKGILMRRTYTALALLFVVALLPSVAHAGRYGGGNSGYVNTPFGPIPMSTMNQAGGNPFMASDMQQQQMMYQQQMMMMKQQQQYMQQQQKMQKAGQNPNGSTQSSTGPTSSTNTNAFTSSASKKKKKTNTSTKSSTTKKSGTGSPSTGTAKSKTTTPTPTDEKTADN